MAAQVLPQPRTSSSASSSPLDRRPAGCPSRCRPPWRRAGAPSCSWFCGRVVDVAGAVFLLEATDAVRRDPACPGWPRAGPGCRVAEVGPELRRAVGGHVVGLGGEGHRDVGQVGHVGQAPRLGPVGQVAVGQQDDRRAVLQGDAGRLDGREEAVRRAVGGDDRQRRLGVAAVHGEQEVGRLGLGRQTGGRAAPLDVDEQRAAARG